MMNVAEHLKRMATDHPEQIALQIPKRSVRETGSTAHHAITFQQLHRRTDALAHGLKSLGIDAGTRTVLMVPPSLDFFALTFALFRITAIPIFIDPGMGIKNLKQCIDNAEPTAFLGIAKAHLARRLLGWGKRTIRISVNVGRRRFFCNAATDRLTDNGLSLGDYPSPIVQRETQAAILFTSGSTGIAKGVEYTHGIFASQIDMLQAIYNIEPGEIDFCTFPLFALFGPALGMSCIIPDMNPSRPATINPLKASAQIAQFQATNMFGSPAVLKALSTGCQSQRLQSLRRVISAGAPATASTLEKLTKLLPKSTPIYTPYGATEALPIANISSEMILHETRQLTEQGHGVCIGKPVPGIEVSVITIRDVAIETWDESLLVEQGTIGEFVVRGPIVTQRYYNKPDATKLAKIYDPATGEILHRMGDVGYFDDEGYMWFCGRKSHRVVTPYGTMYTDQVEPIFNTVDGVSRTALVGVTQSSTTYPVIVYEPAQKHIPLNSIEIALLERGQQFEITCNIKTFMCHFPFPVDVRHNSKIFREKLAVWAASRMRESRDR